IGAAEGDGAGVAGGDLAKGVHRGHGDIEGRAGLHHVRATDEEGAPEIETVWLAAMLKTRLRWLALTATTSAPGPSMSMLWLTSISPVISVIWPLSPSANWTVSPSWA